MNLFSAASEKYIEKRQKERMGHNTGEDVKKIFESVCKDENFQQLRPSVRNGCMRLIEKNSDELTKFYTQSVLNPRKHAQKIDRYTFIRHVCMPLCLLMEFN